MTEAHSFQPDWVSAPGETIADILEEHSLSPTEFASRLGSTVAYTEELIQGKAVVTPEIARKLSLVLGTSEEFWRARESHFRFEVSRLQRGSPSREGEAWLDELPLKDMLAFGWIKVAPGVEYLEACLRY